MSCNSGTSPLNLGALYLGNNTSYLGSGMPPRSTILANCYNSSQSTCSLECPTASASQKRRATRRGPTVQATNWWKAGGSPSPVTVSCIGDETTTTTPSMTASTTSTPSATSDAALLERLQQLLAEA